MFDVVQLARHDLESAATSIEKKRESMMYPRTLVPPYPRTPVPWTRSLGPKSGSQLPLEPNRTSSTHDFIGNRETQSWHSMWLELRAKKHPETDAVTVASSFFSLLTLQILQRPKSFLFLFDPFSSRCKKDRKQKNKTH